MIGHGEWWTENLRWHGNRLLVAYDWDSIIADSEPVIAGLAAAIYIYPALATVAKTRDFLDTYATARGRPFTLASCSAAGSRACGRGPSTLRRSTPPPPRPRSEACG